MKVTRTRVKVCGLTRASDAQAAVRAGADALGVILAPGHRRSLTLKEAARVFERVPRTVGRVGVFVDAPLEDISRAVEVLALTEVQLHGAEGPMYCAAVPAPVVKTFHVGPDFDAAEIMRYRGAIAAVLLDTLVQGVAGGSGKSFDWELGRHIPDAVPVFLAGGLRPANVREAVRRLHPAGVDVSSGVEESPGIKSPELMERFIAEVRAADRENEERTKR
jgi:phosphoribosylanthranilate isomerase